jgi:hypothetical protein
MNLHPLWKLSAKRLISQTARNGDMMNKKCMDFEGDRKTDLHWRSLKRTALRNVNALEQLRKQFKLLLHLREKVVKYTIKLQRQACTHAGWTDQA